VGALEAFKIGAAGFAQDLHGRGWNRLPVPERSMGTLLKAVFAFFVAFSVLSPDKVAAHFDTPRFHAVKAELAAGRPAEKLWLDMKSWLKCKPGAID
jgi:hypothetical protein